MAKVFKRDSRIAQRVKILEQFMEANQFRISVDRGDIIIHDDSLETSVKYLDMETFDCPGEFPSGYEIKLVLHE